MECKGWIKPWMEHRRSHAWETQTMSPGRDNQSVRSTKMETANQKWPNLKYKGYCKLPQLAALLCVVVCHLSLNGILINLLPIKNWQILLPIWGSPNAGPISLPTHLFILLQEDPALVVIALCSGQSPMLIFPVLELHPNPGRTISKPVN
jgi:hypothetical protein